MGDVVKIALTFDWGIHLLEINNGPFLQSPLTERKIQKDS